METSGAHSSVYPSQELRNRWVLMYNEEGYLWLFFSCFFVPRFHVRIIIKLCCLQVDKWKRQTATFWRELNSRFLKSHSGPQCTWELVRTPVKDSFSRLISVLKPCTISFDHLPALNLQWRLNEMEPSKDTPYPGSCILFCHHLLTTAMLCIARVQN